MQQRLVIGTRGSPLALTQTHWVRDRLLALNPQLDPARIKVETVLTTGDRVQDRSLAPIGGKGLFTKEIEERLLDGRIDLAVHSMKDMPSLLPEGLILGPLPKREDPRDALISRTARSLADLRPGARVGTASLRRQAQLLAARPDLEISLLRGNVGTRLARVEAGDFDATLLAQAGLNRLGTDSRLVHPLDIDEMLPAPGQGCLAIELRAGDAATAALLAPLGDRETELCVRAERAALTALDGDCRTPLAIHARLEGDALGLRAQLLSPDGRQCYDVAMRGDSGDPAALGRRAARALIDKAGPQFAALLRRTG